MKNFFFFLLPILAMAQTSFTEPDIRAAAGNEYESLLIGVPAVDTGGHIQYFTYPKTLWEAKVTDCGSGCDKYLVANSPVGDQRYRHLEAKVFSKNLGKGWQNQITEKVVITGDFQLLVQFFTEFWSNSLDFTNIKEGDVVSTRFLTDVATFSFTKNGEPMITVEKAK